MSEQLDMFAPITERDWWHPKIARDTFGATWRDYPPSHPWYYLLGGPRETFEEIGPATWREDLSRRIKTKADSEHALSVAREELDRDRKRYEELAYFGYAVLSDYDRDICYSGDWDLAEACSLALKAAHCANGKAKVADIMRMLTV